MFLLLVITFQHTGLYQEIEGHKEECPRTSRHYSHLLPLWDALKESTAFSQTPPGQHDWDGLCHTGRLWLPGFVLWDTHRCLHLHHCLQVITLHLPGKEHHLLPQILNKYLQHTVSTDMNCQFPRFQISRDIIMTYGNSTSRNYFPGFSRGSF